MSTPEEQIELEKYRAKATDWLNAREHSRSWALEAYRTTAELASTAIKSTFLVNGGALVALIAFLGDAAGKPNNDAAKFGGTLTCFAVGLFFSVVAAAAAYASVYWKAVDPAPTPPNATATGSGASSTLVTRGAGYHRLTILCIIVSIGSFVLGAVMGFSAITK